MRGQNLTEKLHTAGLRMKKGTIRMVMIERGRKERENEKES